MKTVSDLYKNYLERFHTRIQTGQFVGRRVLDVGCGEGLDAKMIGKYATSVVGIDVNASISWKKLENKKLLFKLADAHRLPFKKGVFDGVFIKDVLHHVERPKQVLSEIKRVTKKEGRVIIVEANRYNPIFYFHMTKMLGHNHFSHKQFTALVGQSFPSAHIYTFESHFVPLQSDLFRSLISGGIETIFSMPFAEKIRSYNIAYINV